MSVASSVRANLVTMSHFVLKMFEQFHSFNNILFSDEAHFHLNGAVNKQNCRYWSKEQPKLKHQKPLHCARVTVWAAISAAGIIGPYFFEDARGRAVNVNSERYTLMLRQYLSAELQEFRGHNSRTWFQQDGATCHTSNMSLEVVRELFPSKVISRRANIDWPPRSPDLSPPDYFLWGYLKSRVYVNNPRTTAQLKQNIRQEIAAIPQETCRRVLENFRARLHECQRRDGGHLDDIVFKN